MTKPAGYGLIREIKAAVEARADSWANAILGFGGARDRSTGTSFDLTIRRLSDGELASMYAQEDLSAKIVDVYPREALRVAPEVAGLDAEEEAVADYLAPYEPREVAVRAAIWGRLFGGSAIWLGSYTMTPEAMTRPFVMGEQIDFLRVIDRRFLIPTASFRDVLGRPTLYDIQSPEGGRTIPRVHASRLVMFPGALTDDRIRQQINGWDLSVLQRPYNALRSDGATWKSIENLVSQASTGVLSVQGLYAMIAGGAKEALQSRLEALIVNRGVTKDVVLDKDRESFTRVDTGTFAGLNDISMQGLKRVAAAAEIPVTVLMGEAPAGLNATGDADLRWFFMRVDAYRQHSLAKPYLRLLQCLLAAQGSPAAQQWDQAVLKWPELWTPSALERAEIYSKTATADVLYIEHQVATSDEIGKSRFAEDGYSQETNIDLELREPPPALAAVGAEPGVPGATPPADPAALGAGATPDIAKQAMNGAQVASLVEVVTATATGDLPVDSATAILELAFQLSPSEAKRVIGGAGTTHKVEKEPPPAPFGGGPPRAPAGAEPPTKDPKKKVPTGNPGVG